jgi:hypothetical protein
MELIDAKNKINAEYMKKLLFEGVQEGAEDPSFFDSNAEWLETSKREDFIKMMFDKNVAGRIANSKDVELNISFNDKIMQFTGKDYHWFYDSEKKLQNLIKKVYGTSESKDAKASSQSIKELKSSAEPLHVAVSYDDNAGAITEDFKGTKPECIVWLNKQIVRHCSTNGDIVMLFCLDYDNPDFQWNSLQELFEEGKIVVE